MFRCGKSIAPFCVCFECHICKCQLERKRKFSFWRICLRGIEILDGGALQKDGDREQKESGRDDRWRLLGTYLSWVASIVKRLFTIISIEIEDDMNDEQVQEKCSGFDTDDR